jgi:hypothetical protein
VGTGGGLTQTGPLSLNKDFVLFPLWGEGGPPLVLLATQTPAIPEGRQQQLQQAVSAAAVTVVPYVELTVLHLVSLWVWV